MNGQAVALELYTSEERRLVGRAEGRFGGGPDDDFASTRSDARLGLWRAALSYDTTGEVPFGAWAWIKVQGAVRDGIRERACLRVTVNGESRTIPLQRPYSIDAPLPGAPSDVDVINLGDLIPDPRAEQALSAVEAADDAAWALDTLDARHRYVIEMLYRFDHTRLHVAKQLGVSESRVSQMHHNALRSMRGRLIARQRAAA